MNTIPSFPFPVPRDLVDRRSDLYQEKFSNCPYRFSVIYHLSTARHVEAI